MPAAIPARILRARPWLAALGLMLLVAGGRLAVVSNFGTDLPLQDSWAADSRAFIIPFGTGSFSGASLFYPSNEHHVFFTNLSNAVLAAVSGQWDNRQQTVFNALLCGAVLAGIWLMVAGPQPGWWRAVSFAVIAAAGGLPIVVENIVWGFQSQFLFVAGFSVYALWRMFTALPGTRAWHTGWVAALGAELSFGSGFLASLVVLVFSAVGLVFARSGERRAPAVNAVVSGLLLVFAWVIHNAAPHHAVLEARTFAQFARYLLAGMAWPATGQVWLAPLAYAPLIGLAWRWTREPAFRGPTVTFLLGGGLWVGLQIAAIALTRSNTTMWPPANRYGELYLYGVIFNVAAGVALIDRSVSTRSRRIAATLTALVVLVFGAGAFRASRFALTERLPQMRAEFRIYENVVAAYVRSPDRHLFDHGPIPYPAAYILANLLDMPAVQRYLPESVRDPAERPSDLALMLHRASTRSSWLSRLARRTADSWLLFAGLGTALALAAAIFRLAPGPSDGAKILGGAEPDQH